MIFALYAIALLAALLLAGRLSDHLGRRRVILAALVIEAAAMTCFIAADSTAMLCTGRVLQGVATGSAIGALSAALVELAPGSGRSVGTASVVNSAAPTIGLAAGAAPRPRSSTAAAATAPPCSTAAPRCSPASLSRSPPSPPAAWHCSWSAA